MKGFSILLLKILALYLALNTLYSFIPVFFSGNISNLLTPEILVVLLATIIIPIVSGCLLWKYAELIANKIHKAEPTTPTVIGHDVVSAGLFLIGITLLIKHIGILINYYMNMDKLDYGSLFIIFISLLLVFKNSILINLYSKHNNK
ncbi:hypothetical protein I6E78_10565 [Pseudoalteromonas sp. NZS127]|uniref:hypothetical protein n=1 Tax=unclassified Pseudoalteromonas TaxID=194690 RepID=UPI0018CFC41E|nr:hypothetical protein [Pseudoalteromonas sp. NZS127]MBH0072418.1 hypothetical protein [Pseudoalteromonas sp. NZS127]|tara:strand:+ start:856 stop:1296 length:441 start_codon:yes stop_codon:yes gene_type:complete